MMLLDTCVVSEIARPRPDRGVLSWLETTPEDHLHLSVLTLGEIAKGCSLLPIGARRKRLETWLHDLQADFADRLLGIDVDCARTWGRISAEATRRGRTVGVVDGLIAATALRHGLTVVTRNVNDFALTGAPLLNPFGEARS